MKVCAITGSTGVLGRKALKILPFKFLKFKGNIENYKDVNNWISKNNFDLLIHFAAKVPTAEVNLNFKKALKINYLGTRNLVKALKYKKQKPDWVFFASTSHVYKLNKKKIKTSENEKLIPSSKYGLTKKYAEKEITKLKKNHIKICIGRIFSFTDKSQKKPFVIPSIINKLKKNKSKNITLQNLNHYRDFISTRNIIKVIFKLYKSKSTGVFNIGSGQKINLKNIALLLGKKYRKNITFLDNKYPSYLISDNKKIIKKKIKFKHFRNNLDFFYK